ncbi:hypothetical protein [Modestobacter sp. Leaf380]|uniref:hypothetical protein n=1 Tax=Modestobacter sp. Leaf380 TaxID=1736356 RepID=UPI0006F41628|nr:hypothetical protein [Modestobacter sp. Leaf380]KQS64333.1 hypothetical protein ASG41_16970 [Modestobacter sp. Leaf380]
MLTVLTSGKAAPGVTTTTWALALSWPRPVTVVDCDIAGGDMGPGMLAGRVGTDRGLLSWSAAARHDLPVAASAALLAEHAVQLPERPGVSLIPGFGTATQGQSFSGGAWERMAGALGQTAVRHGRDALVDTGRLLTTRGCWPVVRAADRVLLTVRPTVRSVHAAQETVGRLRDELGDLAAVSAIVVGRGPYPAGEVAVALGLPLIGELPDDRATAAALSDGEPMSLRAMRRSPLMRAASSLVRELAATTGPSLSSAGWAS